MHLVILWLLLQGPTSAPSHEVSSLPDERNFHWENYTCNSDYHEWESAANPLAAVLDIISGFNENHLEELLHGLQIIAASLLPQYTKRVILNVIQHKSSMLHFSLHPCTKRASIKHSIWHAIKY